MNNIGTAQWILANKQNTLDEKKILSVAETSIDRRYFITTWKKSDLHGFADPYECTMCGVALLRSQPCGSAETLFITAFRAIDSSHGNEVQKTNSQQKRHEDK